MKKRSFVLSFMLSHESDCLLPMFNRGWYKGSEDRNIQPAAVKIELGETC